MTPDPIILAAAWTLLHALWIAALLALLYALLQHALGPTRRELLHAAGCASTSAGRQYQHADRSWSLRAVTDEAAAPLERYFYSPFGERTVLNAAGSAILAAGSALPGGPQQYGYTGQRYDAESGLHYFKNRYFQPPPPPTPPRPPHPRNPAPPRHKPR